MCTISLLESVRYSNGTMNNISMAILLVKVLSTSAPASSLMFPRRDHRPFHVIFIYFWVLLGDDSFVGCAQYGGVTLECGVKLDLDRHQVLFLEIQFRRSFGSLISNSKHVVTCMFGFCEAT